MSFRTTVVINYEKRDNDYEIYDQMMDFVKENYPGKWNAAGELEKHLTAYVEFRCDNHELYTQHFQSVIQETVPGIQSIGLYDWAGQSYSGSPQRKDLTLVKPETKEKKKSLLQKLCPCLRRK